MEAEHENKRPRDKLDGEAIMKSKSQKTHSTEENDGAKKIVYIMSMTCVKLSTKLPTHKHRSYLVHMLVKGYGMLKQMRVLNPAAAEEKEIKKFHAQRYVDILRTAKAGFESSDPEEAERYGLNDDCPVFPGLWEYVSSLTGGTIAAAEQLINRNCDIAINWDGGRHHAKRDAAAGFCYVNDCVLGIVKLMTHYRRVMYIDIDIHHGDGVEEAFYASERVLTLSFHHFGKGFYPGSGRADDTGSGKGKCHSVNVPMPSGTDDVSFANTFRTVARAAQSRFQPDVVVLQCGADTLSRDPLGCFNLTEEGPAECLREVLKWNTPLLVLGGGGYNSLNTAKCWALLTSICIGKSDLPVDIPEHECFPMYKPTFTRLIEPGLKSNDTETVKLASSVDAALETIQGIPMRARGDNQ